MDYRLSMIDFVQAYLQSKENLSRKIYLKVRDEDRHLFNIGPGQPLQLLKPPYGICDSGDYWGTTFASFIRNELGMVPLDGDPSLYMLRGDISATGLLGAYVDDNLFAGGPSFEEAILKTAAKFESKPIERDSMEFVGLKVTTVYHDGPRSFVAEQPTYCASLQELPCDAMFSKFISVRSALS